MNCNIFRKKLPDYLENNVVFDMKEAMERHIHECEACRSLYEEEKKIDDNFRTAFRVDTLKFTSSRYEIIKNIEKNKYSNNPVKKLNFHFKRHFLKYIATAAIFTFAIFSAPYIQNAYSPTKSQPEVGGLSKKVAKAEPSPNSYAIKGFAGDSAANKDASTDTQMKTLVVEENNYIPKFEIKLMEPSKEVESGTSWKASPNKMFSASIVGRGRNATEEGMGDIVIKDSNGMLRQFMLVENEAKQNTPMFAEWADDENLLVIIGMAYGTPNVGGNVYRLNIRSGETTMIYETGNGREQVTSISKSDNKLTLELRVYDDDNMMNYHKETRIIDYKS